MIPQIWQKNKNDDLSLDEISNWWSRTIKLVNYDVYWGRRGGRNRHNWTSLGSRGRFFCSDLSCGRQNSLLCTSRENPLLYTGTDSKYWCKKVTKNKKIIENETSNSIEINSRKDTLRVFPRHIRRAASNSKFQFWKFQCKVTLREFQMQSPKVTNDERGTYLFNEHTVRKVQ